MYVPKSSILLAGTGVWKISYVACGFSSIKIDNSDYPKSLIIRINEVYVFSIKYRYSDILLKKHKLHLSRLFRLFCYNHTCHCVTCNMVSLTSASRYQPRYQSRSSMYICGLISRNFAELVEAVPIGRPPASQWHIVVSRTCILKPTPNRSPYIFTLVQKVKHRVHEAILCQTLQVISFENDMYLLHGRS